MFAILALVLGAMGFAGYRVWQNSDKNAQAAGYGSGQGTNRGIAFYACKTALPLGKFNVTNTAVVKTKAGITFATSHPTIYAFSNTNDKYFQNQSRSSESGWSKGEQNKIAIGSKIQTTVTVSPGEVGSVMVGLQSDGPIATPPTQKSGTFRKIFPNKIQGC